MKMSKIIAISLLFGLVLPSVFVGLGDTEPNDSFDEAEQVGEGTFSGTVSYTDEDYYKVSVPAEKSVLVTVTSGSGADISLTLYDGNRVEQDYAYSSNGELDYVFYDRKSSTAYTTYLYFSGDGDYNFTVSFRPSDMQSTATPVSSGDTVNGNIKVGEEVHWYKISLGAKQGLVVSATATGDGIYMEIYDSSGTLIDSNYGSYTFFSLKESTDSAETFYLRVESEGYGYVDITYTFTIEVDSVPSAPQHLQATAGDGYVNLWWGAPADDGGSSITEYEIYRGTSSGRGTYYDYVSGSTRTYTDTDVTNGQTYYYWVSAMNSVGEGPVSSGVSTTPQGTPSAPQRLQATAGDGSVSLSWNAPSDDGGSSITQYNIYRGTSSGGETYYATVSGTTTSYTDTSVTNGQTYYYKVSAVNSIGGGPKSNEVSATPQGTPSAPQNLTATAGDGSVTLSWDAPSDDGGSSITEYKIYRGTSSGSEIYYDSIDASMTNYTDTDVINGHTYYYEVSAVNSAGDGATSSEVSATPSTSNTGGSTPLGASVIITALAVSFGLVLWRRKK